MIHELSNIQYSQMNISQQTVGSLVAKDFRRATVFKKHGIDFCCAGGQTLEIACKKRGVSVDDVLIEFEVAEKGRAGEAIQPDKLDLGVLADYIVNHHHKYVRESIPGLQEMTEKVARVHGAANPEVVSIANYFKEIALELEQHMVKEEDILFPYVKEIEEDERSGQSRTSPMFGRVWKPIRMLEQEHESAGSLMRVIRKLSNDYSPPENACNTYRAAFALLKEFEDDLHEHIHLENNILFPKAIEMEERILTDQAEYREA